ncbi:hypothetical protein GCM10027589_21090 [Actinocorallia lasiicapitis]
MAKDATVTRERLLDAGARLFATEGIDAARTRDIVREAGQANDSAITYHFKSRRGLLEAILRAGVDRMEPARRAADPAGLAEIVTAITGPIAGELRTERGRWFLLIVAQVAGRAGIRSHSTPSLIAGTAIAAQLGLLERECLGFLPESVALERVAAFVAFLTASLADRAARPGPHLLDHDAYTANLDAMLTAALRA